MGYQEKSLGGKIFEKVREDILSGAYEQGEELREATIGAAFNVSRTPVREALRQLELEGLVEIIPNKGAKVTGISRKDVYDIYQMRDLLEGLVARWACMNATEEDLTSLEEVILLSQYHLQEAKQEQVGKLDGRFHELLYHATGSRLLERVLTEFHQYVKRARYSSIQSRKRAEESVREHQEILRAIRERDCDRAEQAAKIHIQRVMEMLALEEDGGNEDE